MINKHIINKVHLNKHPIRVVKLQKKIIAPDYPHFIVTFYKCTCGCGCYATTLTKVDIGYTKNIKDIEYDNPLEAILKFDKLVEECQNGKHDMMHLEEGEAFE